MLCCELAADAGGRGERTGATTALAPRTNQVVQKESSVPRLVQFSPIFVMGCDRDRLPSFLAHVGEVGARAARERDGGERRVRADGRGRGRALLTEHEDGCARQATAVV